MSYLRLDNRELENFKLYPMTQTPQMSHIQRPQNIDKPVIGRSSTRFIMKNNPQDQNQRNNMVQLRPNTKQKLNIRGIENLIKQIGYPDVTDKNKGGIAIWARDTLSKRGYKFLHRVEIIEESIPSMSPVKHFSNIYIWTKIRLNSTQENNIIGLSSDFYYDQGKDLLVIRSDCLDTAVAQASLVGLYSKGKLSFYDIINGSLHKTYYYGVSRKKTKKTLYTILNNVTKR